MRYTLQDKYYSDFNTIDVNRLPGRSYFIPYPSREALKGVSPDEKRYRSPKVKCLNGDWDFIYYDDPKNLPLEFESSGLEFGKIDVPSVWQYRGYSHPMYLNVRYPFTYNPPDIPTLDPVKGYFSLMDGFKQAPEDEMNHVGLYRTFFDVDDTSKRHIVSFLGVCSCIEVHVNGHFAGYSEESHNTAEFDISDYVAKGRNEMVCVVRRWCNGTYLESQDMFRNNGIFRDILLRISDKADIWDIDFKTRAQGGLYSADVLAYVEDGVKVSFKLEGSDPNGGVLTKSAEAVSTGGKARVVFSDMNVIQWNAENPVLYDLYIETPSCCIHQRVGFKTVEVKGSLYLLNGHRVKLKGVNHHDTDPKNGYCMTAAEIRRDLELCKKFNIDTVRTSHYAPDPFLIELAAELGIYIVDEVDIETHGVFLAKFPPSYNRISNNKAWKEHYLSRTVRHYQRDKVLATPVVMWSLGNESGAGCNTDATYDYFKTVSDIPVQYESAIYTRRKAYDIASRMYPPVSELHAIREGNCKTRQFMDRPYFMCEYAHAMGVGPGNIEAYWDEIYNCDSLIGGCVWEMNDHAVQHPDGSLTYGGDHGEWIHDGNFCCDGIFYPDRKPSTGAWIVRHAYRPIRIRRTDVSQFEIFNTTAFTPGSDFTMKISLTNGKKFEYVPKAGPLEKESVAFDLGDISDDCFFTADTYDKAGNLVSTEQICLNEKFITDVQRTVFPSWFTIDDGRPAVAFKDSVMLISDPYTILFRAETDNDSINFIRKPMRKWYDEEITLIGTGKETYRAVSEWAINDHRIRFLCTDVYEGCRLPDGTEGVLVTSTLHPLKGKGKLPRFGKAFRLAPSFSKVSYYGRAGESYIDMKEQFPVRKVKCKVSDMTEPNIKPQESGNRCDVRYAELSDGENSIRFTAVDKSFELSVKPYSDVELISMKHREDEHNSGTYVTINAFQQGIGTGSCGPYTMDSHCYDASKDYTLRFIISREK